ncbi:DNA internalization-related competence protein ComEC/Rec2 [Streptococcus moroccensis]|uniref:Competence protein ComEC n=1 Tax=Streptococcus moroccensis TaxID=1451356 RepID=A0ABT9YQT9_9STRE|nr:DNA internalization-related competence protein ComEC/Rec2 [Streptococcus moroccensis]MDQ0222135.1 competence protein ComEC [Streptococcus moroccensis]
MFQWIKQSSLPPIRLALILVLAFYTLHFPSPITFSLFGYILWRLLFKHSRAVIKASLMILLPFGLFFMAHHYLAAQTKRAAPETISHLQLVPATIGVNGDRLSFRARASGQTFQVFYKLKSKEEQSYFQNLTQTVQMTVHAEVYEAEGQRNFEGFDYQSYLETQGIYKIVQIEQIEAISPITSFNPFDLLAQWRRQVIVHTQRHFPDPMRHYLTGLLFGQLDKDFDQMRDLYSSLGIIHLFALSGMHVSFFVDKFRWLLLRLGLTKELVDWLQLPFSLFYAGMTGFSASVLRSLIQKNLANQGISGLNNLGLTVLISFILMPNFLLTTGGVLSFSYAFILSFIASDDLKGLKGSVLTSLSLSLGILPVLIWHFASYQPLSIVLTFAFSLLFDTLILPLLTLTFLISPFWKIAELNSLFIGLEAIIHWLAGIVQRPFVFGKPSLFILVLLLICLGFLYDSWKQPKIRVSLCLLLISLLFLTKHPLTNEVTIVDVGQGDSIFLRDMKGRNVLIDVGGKVSFTGKEEWQQGQVDSNAERTLIPYLKSRGVAKIDTLVLTHTDTDHIGDLIPVSQAFDIGQIWVSPGSLTDADFVQVLESLNIPVHVTTVGDQIPLFDSYLEVLYPMTTGDGGNNDSIVLYGQLLQTRFLFTGDLEDGELDLIETYPQLSVDVLKAGHHGSKGSSYPAFLDHIQPQIGLFSAGKNNRYQHPHSETLERFEERGITTYRTDQEGAIRFTGWRSWRVETVK